MHGVMDVRGSKPRGVASVPGRAVSRSGTGAVVERKREEGKAKEGEERGERREGEECAAGEASSLWRKGEV